MFRLKTANRPPSQRVRYDGCAWRAVYLYVGNQQVAHLGVDPGDGVTPKIFGGVNVGLVHSFRLIHSFRVALPAVRWRNEMSPLRMRVYRLSKAFWHNVDGRFGWGSVQP